MIPRLIEEREHGHARGLVHTRASAVRRPGPPDSDRITGRLRPPSRRWCCLKKMKHAIVSGNEGIKGALGI